MGEKLIVPWTSSLKKQFIESAELTAQEDMVFGYITKTNDTKKLCYLTGYSEDTVQSIIDSIIFKYDCVWVQNQEFPPRFQTQEDLQTYIRKNIVRMDEASVKDIREEIEKHIKNEKKRKAMIRKLCDGATDEAIAAEMDMSVNGIRKMIQAGKAEIERLEYSAKQK